MHAHRPQSIDHREQAVVGKIIQLHFAIGHRRGNRISPRHDSIRHHGMIRPAQFLNPFNRDPGAPRTGNFRSHRIE